MPRYDFAATRLFVSHPLSAGAILDLERDQSNYILNVLRLRESDTIFIFNGRDGEWMARIAPGSRKVARLEAIEPVRLQQAACDLHYLFAPIKHARLDYMAQKAVEMGASRLQPVLTRRTQVQRVNLDRLRANAIEAAEQCGIMTIAEVAEPVDLERVLRDWPASRRLIFCDEDADVVEPVLALRQAVGDARAPALAVLIGPEGGFDPAERKAISAVPGVIGISLGPRILRADTAAVAALAVVQAAIGDWRG
ncbi:MULTISPECIES: 16S rRNA (uracil(1498)-N(3))-methyltransferase [unclassified Beijerinckia]|uniref:16S rRNA (uracil(1498)-N(3))-methyltransferase n=1 Tax=unclassified Beijerinckia TaxID=2638183 RepID=UPI000897CABD|nr:MULTISPECIES: 16S rRNA (uracil(1498)-N(3))-methyltransferase [unclassified Beijerinckia]MDH7796686.1 16S rRNA (uracil1498-N3)-methyltransferase [Beijerinckia sp. GAS462]SEC55698.1 16S rRNA (uracil1498-N3)-methyltransferase [Beijerinckia sp. 28-YEA-48]